DRDDPDDLDPPAGCDDVALSHVRTADAVLRTGTARPLAARARRSAARPRRRRGAAARERRRPLPRPAPEGRGPRRLALLRRVLRRGPLGRDELRGSRRPAAGPLGLRPPDLVRVEGARRRVGGARRVHSRRMLTLAAATDPWWTERVLPHLDVVL